MAKKYLSLIIVPHPKGTSKTISFSQKLLKSFLAGAIILFLVLAAFLVDYISMSGTRQKYKTLSKSHTEQSQTLAQYKETVDDLKAKISQFESYAKKLNVMAGLKSSEIIEGELGIGDASVSQETSLPEDLQTTSVNSLENISQKAEGLDKNLNTLVHFFEDQNLRLAATPSIKPTKGYASSAYGWRNDPFTGKRTFHKGIDFATYFGNPVVATADGVVIQTTSDKIGGKTIKVSHKGGYTTVYCHLSRFLAKPGQKVKRGETIGLVGQTGKAIGPHVHYEVRLNGKDVNPYYYILEE